MIGLTALTLLSIVGSAQEGINYYDIPCRIDFEYTTSFNTVLVTGSSNVNTQSYTLKFGMNATLRGNKNVLPDGTYAFGVKPESCVYTVFANNLYNGTQELIYQTSQSYAGYSIPIEDFASGVTFYDSISTFSSSFRFNSSMYYAPADDDIFNFDMAVTQSFTSNRSSPRNVYYHTVDYSVLYNQCLTAFKGYINIDYQQGYENGFYEGEKVGIKETTDNMQDTLNEYAQTGYDNGYTVGYNAGVVAGNNKNITLTKLFWSVIDEPFAVIYRLLDFEVLGVNLFAFASGLVTLGLVGWVVKMII